MLNDIKIAIIGAGKMGETLSNGLVDAKVIEKKQLVGTVKHTSQVQAVKDKLGIEIGVDNIAAVKDADIILLCVKPQVVADVLDEVKDCLIENQVLVSIAAGVTTKFIEEKIGKKIPVIRAMPNTPCLIKKGMTGICSGSFVADEQLKQAEFIFNHVGRTVIVDEKHMDAVTGLGASGPAFIYVVIESMAEGGVKAGLPRNIATELAAQAVLGAASMVLDTGEHPALLKDVVTTPAGCTIDGLMELEEGGLRVTFIKTIIRATERASQLVAK